MNVDWKNHKFGLSMGGLPWSSTLAPSLVNKKLTMYLYKQTVDFPLNLRTCFSPATPSLWTAILSFPILFRDFWGFSLQQGLGFGFGFWLCLRSWWCGVCGRKFCNIEKIWTPAKYLGLWKLSTETYDNLVPMNHHNWIIIILCKAHSKTKKTRQTRTSHQQMFRTSSMSTISFHLRFGFRLSFGFCFRLSFAFRFRLSFGFWLCLAFGLRLHTQTVGRREGLST